MNQKTKRVKNNQTFKGLLILLVFFLTAMGVYTPKINKAYAQPADIESIVTIPEDLKPMDPPEIFGPENLYEKINGQAELYLSAGFLGLKCQLFAEEGDPDSTFEVYIYNMGDGLNAFSVYSMQRREDAQKVDLGQFAYRTENSLYFIHGPYYVEMMSVGPSGKVLSKMELLAKNFIEGTPVDRTSIEGFGLFPKENLNQGSILMIPKNAFGYDRLDRVFAATYTLDEGEVTAYISKRKTPEEAKELVLGFHKFFMSLGGKDIVPDVSVKDAKMVEIMDGFEIVFFLNSYMAGVHEATTKKQAERFGEILAKTLREVMDAK